MSTTKLLRIYTSESAYSDDIKVFQLICETARLQKISGATVLDARLGFGRDAHLRHRHILEDERSVVIEIVDEEAALRQLVASLSDVTGIALIIWRRSISCVSETADEGPDHPLCGRQSGAIGLRFNTQRHLSDRKRRRPKRAHTSGLSMPQRSESTDTPTS